MPSHARTLTRATIASIVATSSEFALLPLLVHVAHAPAWVAYAGVQFVAQAITFLLNKYWAFEAGRVGTVAGQGAKSLAVFGGSLGLNTALPSLGSYVLHAPPVAAFAVSQVLVYLAWNYPMNRFWVFRRARPSGPGAGA
jgi:putative flippase GtrA